MSGSLFSPSWHRVDKLHPKLRSHVHFYRHTYRGQLWYVLYDKSNQRSHRFTPTANYLIGLMDGNRTVQQIWDTAINHMGDDAPTQEETIQLLSQLFNADAILCDVTPVVSELFKRYAKDKKQAILQRFINPMALRIPLFDPNNFLKRSLGLVKLFFSKGGAILWLLVVGSATILAGMHWLDLTENVADKVLAPENLLLIWLIFPLIKAAHEFGHAYAAKIWGGEVHEMGIMFLLFMPVPYVDASSTSSFREKHKRMLVGAGGMLVELFLAALALFVWLSVEPGIIRSIAYNIILIASVSTILFNINPLLKFDGYYILSDLIEIQNLAPRSTKHIGYLVQKYIFGLKSLTAPSATIGERRWFVGFGISSFIYRMFIVIAIASFVATKFFFVGVLLAGWAVFMMVIKPSVTNIHKLLTSPHIGAKRNKVIMMMISMAAILFVIVSLVPLPSWTRTEGVIWVDGNSVVYAETDCFIDKIAVQSGRKVHRNDVLILCSNPELHVQLKKLHARKNELAAQYQSYYRKDRVKANIVKEQIGSVSESLAIARKDVANLVIRSKSDGIFAISNPQDLLGRYVKRGQRIAYTLDMAVVTTRLVIDQADIDLVRQETRKITLRLTDQLNTVSNAKIKRITPAATNDLPSMALSQQGGGAIALDPRESGKQKAYKKFFILDLEFTNNSGILNIGSRVYVRFDHGFAPLLTQVYRRIRQLFMSQFNV